MSQWIMAEYECQRCGEIVEELVGRPMPEFGVCLECSGPTKWIISAAKLQRDTALPTAAVRGGDMKERPPGMLDTRPLGDGSMTPTQWKAHQRKLSEERRWNKMVRAGLVQKKIIG